jgi:hypothetical protein
MSTGADASKQARTQDTSGGNIVNKGPTNHKVYTPPPIVGRGGSNGDTQSTSRPKGST